jgi:hypothetical protein
MQTHKHDLGITARSLSGFSSCKLSIAFNPNGVAAESNPS